MQHTVATEHARKPIEALINPLAVFIRNGEFWFETEHEGQHYKCKKAGKKRDSFNPPEVGSSEASRLVDPVRIRS
jgi:hypothetical protein